MTPDNKAKGDVMREEFEKRNPPNLNSRRAADGQYLYDVTQTAWRDFVDGWQAAAKHYSTVACGWQDDWLRQIGEAIHYPQCWDTAAYPTLLNAILELAACSEHPTPLPAQDEKELREVIINFAKELGNSPLSAMIAGDTLLARIRPYLRPTPPQVDIVKAAQEIHKVRKGVDAFDYDTEDLEYAEAAAAAWGLTEGGKAPDLAALYIEKLVAELEKLKHYKIPLNKFDSLRPADYVSAINDCIEVIRQNQRGEL